MNLLSLKRYADSVKGPGGSETAAWAKAAGMENFETFYMACEKALTSDDFQWPDRVTQVDLGGGHIVTKPG